MKIQRETAREATRAALGDVAWTEDVLKNLETQTEFTGYTSLESDAEVLAIIYENELTDSLGDEDEATVVLSKTPFYAECGGQVGDSGLITCGRAVFEVSDCKKSASGHIVHVGRMKEGVLSVGDHVKASVTPERRRAIMRNHSSCHLLQKALQEVLGDHVHQAGSYVDEHVCRFDFSHFSAMTPEEIRRVEHRVNELILEANPVTASEMPIEEAKKLGAMALFGEKYGSVVRVVNMNEKSIEFCGGTHVDNTAKLGLFKILRESSVAAGIRRIEAATGWNVLNLIYEDEKILHTAAHTLKLGNPSELVAKTAQLQNDLKARDKAISELQEKAAAARMAGLFENAETIASIRFVAAALNGSRPDALRLMCDNVKDRIPNGVTVLTSILDGKGSICVACGPEAVAAGAHAGKIVKALCGATGGNGGGRADSAMGGAGDPFKIDEAVAQLPDILRAMVEA